MAPDVRWHSSWRYRSIVRTPINEFVVRRPPPALGGLVAEYVGYRLMGFDAGVHVGLPSPWLTVIITLDRPLSVRWDEGSGCLRALVGGLHDHPVRIDHDGTQFGIQLALTPLGCRALCGAPAAAIARSVAPLEALLGPRARELVHRASAATTWPARFAVVDQILLSAVDDAAVVRPEIRAAWHHLLARRGAVTVSAVADAVGWSRRHLAAQFRNELGLSPKTVARMARFDHAQQLLRRPNRPSVGMVAALAGYADQAHLTREWREFAGTGPVAWLAAEELPFVQDDTGSAAAPSGP